MFGVFLKILIATLLAGLWSVLDESGEQWIALAIFMFVLAVLVKGPIRFQSPEKREEYIQKMRESKERKAIIADKQREERIRLKKEREAREQQAQKQFHERMKNKKPQQDKEPEE